MRSVAFGSSRRIGSSSCWARIHTFAGEAVSCFLSNLSDWSERKVFHSISLLGFGFEQERHLPVVEYWCERLRSFTSLLLEILVWIERKKGFLSTSGPFSEIL